MQGDSIYIGPGDEQATTPSPRDFRIEALAFLFSDLARRDPRAVELRARHPDAATIDACAPRVTNLTDLLFDELTALESERLGVSVDRNLQNHEPFAYWLRRRELAHHAELVAVWGELPPLFVALARATAEQIQHGTAELGARMIAGALRPLASNVMRRVLELVADTQEARARAAEAPARLPIVPQHDAVSADLWLATLERISGDSSRGPKRAGDLLGRTLLATLFRGLDESLRRRARELAVTVIVKKLNESDVIAIDSASPTWRLAETLADDVFQAGEGGPAS